MKQFVELTADEEQFLSELTASHPIFRTYFLDAKEGTRRGAKNRFASVGRQRQGGALGITFDNMEIRTLIGRVAPDEELNVAMVRGSGELHVDQMAAERIEGHLGSRLLKVSSLRYYLLADRPSTPKDTRCISLGIQHQTLVGEFFRRHYPDAVFSNWMLTKPFVGVLVNGDLAACGGVIAAAEGIASVGNFLTSPQLRGRGFCRSIAAHLACLLFDTGFSAVTLGTTEENVAACRAYESVGFKCFDKRLQLDIG